MIKRIAMLVWPCHQHRSRFLDNGHLPRVERQSCLSANDMGGNEAKPGAVDRSKENVGDNKDSKCSFLEEYLYLKIVRIITDSHS